MLVHGQYGADRTGTMCARYRVACRGGTKDAAPAEMTEDGFGFHALWSNRARYARELDVERIALRTELRVADGAR